MKFRQDMKSLWAVAFILLYAFFCLGFQWTDNLDSIRRAGSNVNSLSALFTQTNDIKILKHKMVLNGAFYYQRPGSIRWEYTTPYKSILLMNKGQLRRFTWSDNQWIQNTDPTAQVMQPVILEMRRWLSGRFTSSPTFKAALEPGQPRRIILIPGKAIRDFIQRVVLQLGRRPGTIRKVEIRQYQGASTSIEFRELRINSELPRELFERP